MEMYKVHQDAQLIPLKFDPTMYAFNGEAFPALSVSASKDANGITHISLVNIDSKRESKIVIDINHLNVKNIYGSILTSQKLQDHNTFDKPNKIKPIAFKSIKYKNGVL